MNDGVKYQVVLASYNGGKYIYEQIASIISQIGSGELLIHDDGSTDDTPAILNDWAKRDPRIRLLSGPPQGGASANFSYLLQHADAPYVFCADQDDIWCPNKLQSLLSRMRFYEGVYGEDTPLLLHSDLSLIDEHGRLIAPSMWRYQNLNPQWGDHFNLLLTQNVVTGCAMLVNRALLERALPIPPDASMHDHWLALVACGQGKVIWMGEPTVLYRQHGSNEVGAESYSLSQLYSNFILGFRKSSQAEFDARKRKLYEMAGSYAVQFSSSSTAQQARDFNALRNSSIVLRPLLILRGKFFRSGFLRNVAWIFSPHHFWKKNR